MNCSSLEMDCEDLSRKTPVRLKLAIEKHIQTLSLVDSDAKSLESGIASLNSQCSFSRNTSFENPSSVATDNIVQPKIPESLDLHGKPSHTKETADNETRSEKNQESTGDVISDGLFKVPGHRDTGYAGEMAQQKSPGRQRLIRRAFADKDGDTILHIAALQPEREPRLSNTADDAVTERPGRLRRHCHRPSVATLVRALGLRHDDVNARNRRHQTPLHLAVAAANHGAVAELLALGASLMAQDWRGDTPLHGACRRRDFRVLAILLGGDMKRWSKEDDTEMTAQTTTSPAASSHPAPAASDPAWIDSPSQSNHHHRTSSRPPVPETGNRKDPSAREVTAQPPTTTTTPPAWAEDRRGRDWGSSVEPNPTSRGSSAEGAHRSSESFSDTDCTQAAVAQESTIALLDRDQGVKEGVKSLEASSTPLGPGCVARQDDGSRNHKRRSKHPGYVKENPASSNFGPAAAAAAAAPYARPRREFCKLPPTAPDSSESLSSSSLSSTSSSSPSSSDSFSLREVCRTSLFPARVVDPVAPGARAGRGENAERTAAAAVAREELRRRAALETGPVRDEQEPEDASLYRRRSWQAKESRAALSAVNYDGLTCLHLAVLSGECGMVQLLLTCGADANAKDGKSGRTALHFAVDCPQPDLSILAALLRHPELQVDAANFARQTALQLARGRLHLHLLPLLQARGARWSDAASDHHCSSDSCCSDEEMEEAFPEHYDELCQAEKLSAILRQW